MFTVDLRSRDAFTTIEEEQLIYPLSSLVSRYRLNIIAEQQWAQNNINSNRSRSINVISTTISFHFPVAEFGGTLGLFLGFSFIAVWDKMVFLRIAFLKINSSAQTWYILPFVWNSLTLLCETRCVFFFNALWRNNFHLYPNIILHVKIQTYPFPFDACIVRSESRYMLYAELQGGVCGKPDIEALWNYFRLSHA